MYGVQNYHVKLASKIDLLSLGTKKLVSSKGSFDRIMKHSNKEGNLKDRTNALGKEKL